MGPTNGYFKITVHLERREDGGLRAYSDEVPGFVLSHSDAKAVLADIKPALEQILSHMLKGRVKVEKLIPLSEKASEPEVPPAVAEYVTHRIAA
jgi:hypothetical protein